MTGKVLMPKPIADLPRDKHGRPVPWFVAFIDGEPDFRVIRSGGIEEAFRFGWCWVCGRSIKTRFKAFVIGPMCSINRTSAEPPCHWQCAEYAAMACPFLATPNMVRRDRNLPEVHTDPSGVMILRNPGVAAVWITPRYTRFRVENGWLFNIGEPNRVLWYAEGRTATRAEVEASIVSGLPLLTEAAERDGPSGVADLAADILRARKYLPIDAMQGEGTSNGEPAHAQFVGAANAFVADDEPAA